MQQEFDAIASDMEPTSESPKATTAAAIANRTKVAYNDAINRGYYEHAKKFLSLHEKAIEKTTFEDINTELARFYFRAYELQSAEMNIKTVAKLTEETVPEEEAMQFIESNIERLVL